MATYEDANRSGRKICAMRYLGRDAMDIVLQGSTWQAEKEPIMSNRVDHAPGWQRRLGYFSGRVDRPYGKKTN